MLLVGTYDVISTAYKILSIKDNVYVINLSSANLQIKPSSLFYVPKADMESNMYDMEYANYIYQNTEQRIEFLYMIHELLNGNHVLIMIGNYPGMYEMAESLLKLIQCNYGYNGYIIQQEDLLDLDMFQSKFSVPGLQRFDTEKIELDEIFLQEEKRYSNGYQ